MKAVLRGLALGLVLLGSLVGAQAGIAIDAERELQLLGKGVEPPKRFGNVAFRVAVFSYEDPDGLDLGDALAGLVSHEMLAGAKVSSIGVLRYVGRLTPKAGEEQGYFDKVNLLAQHQEPTLALWGMVRRDGDHFVVESYLQIPPQTMTAGLQARLKLPPALGGGELRASLGYDRMLLQRLRLPISAVAGLRRAAQRLGELRQAPKLDAAVVARLPLQTVYYVNERRNGWVRMTSAGSVSGWVPLKGHCTGPCAALLDGPRFVSEILNFIKRRQPPEPVPTLAQDARQLRDHLFAMAVLDQAPPAFAHEEAIAVLTPWLPQPGQAGAGGPSVGAASANLRLLATLTGELRRARAPRPAAGYGSPDPAGLTPQTLRAAAYEAAEATLVDPRNIDLLHNLQVLYRALGDDERAGLAERLLAQARSSSRQRW